MRVLFLHHGSDDPSTRYRVDPWIRLLRADGITCDELPRSAWRYRPQPSPWRQRASGYAAMARTVMDMAQARRYDAVFMQRFLVPPRAALLDRLLRASRRLIFDVSDALFCSPRDDRPRYAARLRRLAAAADTVLVSNRFVADWLDMPAKTVVMPSVVDCDAIPARPSNGNGGRVRIAWTGQAYQLDYLRPLFGVLRDIARDPRVEIVFHTSSMVADAELRAIGVTIMPFDPRQEAAVLASVDIGLMPMPRTVFNLGKCPLKLVQYMAAGCAVVCSPVGSNLEMVEDGVNGYHADTPSEWAERLAHLIAHPDERAAMGRAGRRRAEERYSVRANWPRFRDAFARAVGA